jgi:hypothetical protein
MGDSPYPFERCQGIVQEFTESDRWLSDRYNLLYHNCNNFSFELCQALLGEAHVGGYPEWVRNFEKVAVAIFSLSLAPIVYLNNFSLSAFGRPPEPIVREKKKKEREPPEGGDVERT